MKAILCTAMTCLALLSCEDQSPPDKSSPQSGAPASTPQSPPLGNNAAELQARAQQANSQVYATINDLIQGTQ